MQSVKLQPQSTSTKRSNKKLSAVGSNQSKSERNERAAISAHYRAYKARKTDARGFFGPERELADWLAAETEENS